MQRYVSRLLLSALLIGSWCSALAADTFPSRPIHVIVPYPPGGTTDTTVRLIMQDVAQRLNQSIIIENKPGASGGIGAAYVSTAAADGYTYAAVINAFVFNPLTGSKTFDPAKLTGVSIMVTYPIVMAVGGSQPWQSLQDFIADARKRGNDAFSYASSGIAGHSHVASEMLAQAIGVHMVHVPYAGDAPRLRDIKEGAVAFGYFGTPFVAEQAKSGALRALAVTGAQRSPLLPNVPTVAEQGYPQLETTGWVALLAPVGAPDAIQQRMAAEIATTLKKESVRNKLVSLGVDPDGTTPAEARAFLAKDFSESKRLIDQLHMQNLMQQ